MLSSDYSVEAVKPVRDSNRILPSAYNAQDQKKVYVGRHKSVLNKLPESVYSTPLAHTQVHDYDSRMEWITEAAKKYHRLMLSDTGRPFLEKELAIIAGWGNSKAEFKVGRDSNDGKV